MARKMLDVSKRGPSALSLLSSFEHKVVGQADAVSALVDVVTQHQAGHGDATRPAGSLLFLGPTGTGKTHVVESLCHGLFGNEKAMVKIDCAEFQHSHEIAKLVGSPPGYLGHRETPPLLKQARLDQYFTEKQKIGVLLFDEIEKASDALWQLLLGVLDRATMTMGDNTSSDFSNQIIIMTSNLGSKQMSELTDGGFGFANETTTEHADDAAIESVAINAAKKKFTAEFFNRLDKVTVFKTLTKQQIRQVLDLEIREVQSRLFLNLHMPFYLSVSPTAKTALMDEGYSTKYGARELRRVIRKRVQMPLSGLVTTGQIPINSDVYVDHHDLTGFVFSREEK